MKGTLILLLISVWCVHLCAQVSLAGIFSDNMVLQAHRPIKVWGNALPGEKVRLALADQHRETTADQQGRWMVEFSPMNYAEGVVLHAAGKYNEVSFTNLLVGEVWLCSGQSNMAMTVNGDEGQVLHYKSEERSATYTKIRSFKVSRRMATIEATDVEGTWEVCSPETVGGFSAVAYFFARKLHEETGVPVGIINASWGGTDIETWISTDAFQALPARFDKRYEKVRILGLEDYLRKNEESRKAFAQSVATDIGMMEQWYDSSFDSRSWPLMSQPQEWATTGLASFNGVVWLKYALDLVEADIDQPALLALGKVDDNDITWINGVKIGETSGAGYERMYGIPAGVLKKGENVITVRVVDMVGSGGLTSRADELYLKTVAGQYSLTGNWQYQTTVEVGGVEYHDVAPNVYYGLLYNGMIAPLRNFAIKGAIWYQGENNTGRAYDYRTLFPTLINDWRQKWDYEFPFYWVQLANFMNKSDDASAADNWAELREAQTLTLAVSRTGQAITIDIGDANDIHPKNKQDVGARLANLALHHDYGRSDILCESPLFKTMRIDDDRIIIEFDHVGEGLQVASKYGYIKGFAIAGEDGRFVWAKAHLKNDKEVVARADGVKKPVAVRYCWSINPDVNLYNSAGLPATPFRTDQWKLSTE